MWCSTGCLSFLLAEVMGAAFATSISIMAGGLVAMVYLLFYARHLRLQPLKWSVKSLRLSVRNIGYQCRIGPSALLGEATLAVLMFVGNQVFMSYLGDDGVGAFGIACYYIPFVFMVGNAIAQSAQPIISYNFGLGYKEKSDDGGTYCVADGCGLRCGCNGGIHCLSLSAGWPFHQS